MANTNKSSNVRVFDKFEYHLEDLDCSLCVYWRKKNGCSRAVCPYEDIRGEAIANGRIKRKRGWNKE